MISIKEANRTEASVMALVRQANEIMAVGTTLGLRFEVVVTERQSIGNRHPTPSIDVLTFVNPHNIEGDHA